MKRGGPLKRGKPMKRSGNIKPRSKKMSATYEERRPLVERLLVERPYCQACSVFAGYDGLIGHLRRPSSDVHELLRRSQGGSILDLNNLLCVCRPCHRRITDSPGEAFALGLAVPSWADADVYREAAEARRSWAVGVPYEPSWIR